MLRAATKAARRSSRSSGSVIARCTYGFIASVESVLVFVFALVHPPLLGTLRKNRTATYVGYDRPRAGSTVARPPPAAAAGGDRGSPRLHRVRVDRRSTGCTRGPPAKNGSTSRLARARAHPTL